MEIIDGYEPFDEPNASFEKSVKVKINQRFNDKTAHKIK